MSNLFVLSPDNYVTCPYDSTHRVLWPRMPFHLMKCRNQHVLDPLQSCPFNMKHMVPEHKMHFHMLMCEAKVIIESDIISRNTQPESLQDEPKGYQQVPDDSSVLRSAEQGLERNVSNNCCARKKFPSKLMTGKMLAKIETLSENDKELTWDEEVRQSGVIIQPFKFGERSFSPDLKDCESSLKVLRKPLNVVQISESRQARNPLVYNYAMNSVGIGRGAGRGKTMYKTMTTRESCSDANFSVSRIGSLGVGRAKSRIS